MLADTEAIVAGFLPAAAETDIPLLVKIRLAFVRTVLLSVQVSTLNAH